MIIVIYLQDIKFLSPDNLILCSDIGLAHKAMQSGGGLAFC